LIANEVSGCQGGENTKVGLLDCDAGGFVGKINILEEETVSVLRNFRLENGHSTFL
jgi:hypothetical protein